LSRQRKLDLQQAQDVINGFEQNCAEALEEMFEINKESSPRDCPGVYPGPPTRISSVAGISHPS